MKCDCKSFASLHTSALLTVAICSYRRFSSLERCLQSLRNQSGELLKITVIDNSLQMKQSEEMARRWYGLPGLSYVITEKSGLSYARNLAVDLCGTDYIAFLDDDAYVRSGWLAAAIGVLERYKGLVGVVGGPCYPVWEDQPPGWLAGELVHPLGLLNLGRERLLLDDLDKDWLIGANIIYLKSALEKVGRFEENLGRKENLLLCHEELVANRRIRSMGYSALYEPAMSVDHLVQKKRMTIEWMFEDAFWETISRRLAENTLSYDLLKRNQKLLSEALESGKSGLKSAGDTKEVIKCRRDAANLAVKTLGVRESRTKARNRISGNAICVLVPVLDKRTQLELTIESILKQSGDFSVHLHIQDGGSTDGTLELVEKYQIALAQGKRTTACRNVILTFRSVDDTGMYDGLCKASEHLLCLDDQPMTWINAGDFFLPGAFSFVIKAMERHPSVSWIIPPVYVFEDEQPKEYAQVYYPRNVVESGLADGVNWRTIQQEGSFWRYSLWKDAVSVLEGCRAVGDWMLWRKYAVDNEPYHARLPLAVFVSGEDNMSRKQDIYQREMNSVLSRAKRRELIGSLLGERYSEIAIIDADTTVRRVRLPLWEMALSGSHEVLVGAMQNVENLPLDLGGKVSAEICCDSCVPWYKRLYRILPESMRGRLRPLARRLFIR